MQKIICTCCGQEITKTDRFCPNCAENNEYYESVSPKNTSSLSNAVQSKQNYFNQSKNININHSNLQVNKQILTSINYFSNSEKVKIWLENENLVVNENSYNDIVIRIKKFLDNLVKANLSKYNYDTAKINILLNEINLNYSWEEIPASSSTFISKILSLLNDVVYHKSLEKFINNVLKNQKVVLKCVNSFIEKNNTENQTVDNSKTVNTNITIVEQTTKVVECESNKSIKQIKLMSKSDLKQIYNKLLFYGFKGFVHGGDYSTIKQILLTNKVLSRIDAKGKFKDIADQEIIANTSEFVKSKVRFYYASNTPVYYHFDKKSTEFVILQFDFSLVEDYEVYFLDGNAASDYSRKSQTASEIISFDWATIFSRGPIYDDEDKIDIKRKRDAELLVKGPVYVDKYLRKIIVKNENVAKKIKHDFPKYSGIIIVDPHSFC